MSLKKLKNLKTPKPQQKATLDKINDYLFKTYNKGSSSTNYSHKPSMVGAACMRKIYYSYFRTPEDVPVDPKGARIFETGKFLEEMVISWLKAIGEYIPYIDGDEEKQYEISIPEWGVQRGFIDNIAILDDKLWVYEIKTMNTKKFQELEAPVPQHVVQAGLYYIALTKYPLLGIDRPLGGVKFLYVDKNTSEIKEFNLTSEELETIVPDIEARLTKANSYTNSKILPPKTTGDCFFCPWRIKCKDEINPVKL